MEQMSKKTEKAPEPSVRPESQGFTNGVTSQEGEEEESQTDEEEEESQKTIIRQWIIQLQRDLTTLVTNVQTAADAKVLAQRAELEEARNIRTERLQNDEKASQEKIEEITSGWSVANQKMTVQELQKTLKNQEQLCVALIEDKKRLINDLQQELKVRDDRYVRNLKKNDEEIDLMIERMEEQIKVLTKAYREELDHVEKVHEQGIEVLLTKDESTWEQHMKELWEQQLERLAEKKNMVEEYETKLHDQLLENSSKYTASYINQNEKDHQREQQQMKGTNMVVALNNKMKKHQLEEVKNTTVAHMRRMNHRMQAELKKLKASQEKELKKKNWHLSADYQRAVNQYERMQQQIKHFAVADSKKFNEMWVMVEGELKQLVEEALALDSRICEHLGLAWKRPPMAFMHVTGPIQPQQTHQQSGMCFQSSHWMMDASVGPSQESGTESADVFEGGTAAQSVAEVEEGKLSTGTMKKLTEKLCDEAGFLMEDNLQKLLAPLEDEEQSGVKMGLFFSRLGIDDRDAPKLADFLLKYKRQQREQTEDVCAESSDMAEDTSTAANTASELINPNHVLPALKSFIEQHTRASSSHHHSSFRQAETRDSSEDAAYWESMCSVITEDKLRLWEAAETILKQYHAVLTEISELVPATEHLEQQNAELRIKLQQVLDPIE
ncbi:dynein regulatory complex protein 1 [Mugil cephalus]|uniref:dynein regulatory complex protein 1 n=1 Tax=Mugil cephalus TaxID=48193 RepID=UPI001FB57140|nr:dynein regulatory complex protein 1 [Mugil cephalus]